jgi:hypothetical protein
MPLFPFRLAPNFQLNPLASNIANDTVKGCKVETGQLSCVENELRVFNI